MEEETKTGVILLSNANIYKVSAGLLLRSDAEGTCSITLSQDGIYPIFSVSFLCNNYIRLDPDGKYIIIGMDTRGKVNVMPMKCLDYLLLERMVYARMTFVGDDISKNLMDVIMDKSTYLYPDIDQSNSMIVIQNMDTLCENDVSMSMNRAINHIKIAISELEKVSKQGKNERDEVVIAIERLREGSMWLANRQIV